MPLTPGILALFALAAALYAMAGHGGGSAYLALMSILGWPRDDMRATALTLNLAVAGITWLLFLSRGGFRWKLFLPCALGGIPAAWLGGTLGAPAPLFWAGIAAALLVAAYRTARLGRQETPAPAPAPGPVSTARWMAIGAAIGLLSGACGIGGGVFLGPLLLLTRTATAHEAAAISAAYILVNSAVGLAAAPIPPGWSPPIPLLLAVTAAGTLGAWFGSRRATPILLRRALALALTLAASKCLLNAL